MADMLNDAVLLERFVDGREEAAFTALMRRHVPVVRAACRRVLQSEHDAEDVVQATFLVLALKAAEVNWRESIGGWLCAVARRLSLDARAGAYRRSRRETPTAAFSEQFHPTADPLTEIEGRELRVLLDDELKRLPEKYRNPLVLCDLEGLSHAEAARRLGLPSGSISRRLGKARAILRGRLVGRGLPAAVLTLSCIVVGLWVMGPGSIGARRGVLVREAMAPFKKADGARLDLSRFLSLLDASPSLFPSDEATSIARNAAGAADRLAGVDPGHDRPAWRSYASELRLASNDMAQASRDGDGVALLAASRRANASCVQCHLAFRQ